MNNKATNRYVFVDTETGGIIPGKHSLLSIGFAVWEKEEGIIATKEFFVKNKDYVVTEEAKRINHFDMSKHEQMAKMPVEVIKEILEFLTPYFENMAIPLIGHNVMFDVNFLKVFFKENGRSFNQYFSHRIIDTYSIYKSLAIAGIIDNAINSSSDAFKYFNIEVNNRHSALGDSIATVELFEKLLGVMQSCK